MRKLIELMSGDPTAGREHSGNSVSDRLSSTYTVSLLMGFAFTVQFSHFFGNPVECWCPAQFTSTHAAYTNKVCWTSNTYFLPYDRQIDPARDDREYVSYYQWVALVLAFQAVFFLLPKVIWTSVSSMSGVAVSTVVGAAIKCGTFNTIDDRKKAIEYMVNHLDRACKKIVYGRCSAVKGYFLPLCYLGVKVVYFANVVAQLFILNAFLDTEYNFYGIDILKKMALGESWINSTRFPRVTLCDFKIRHPMGKVHRYTVQCSMHMNLFHEIIYIVIWFWFVFVAAMTAGSFLAWFLNMTVPRFNRNFVKKRLVAKKVISQSLTNDETRKFNRFIRKYLKGDGCFILRMVSRNASDLVSSDIIEGLWTAYCTDREENTDKKTGREPGTGEDKGGPRGKLLEDTNRNVSAVKDGDNNEKPRARIQAPI